MRERIDGRWRGGRGGELGELGELGRGEFRAQFLGLGLLLGFEKRGFGGAAARGKTGEVETTHNILGGWMVTVEEGGEKGGRT